MSVVPFPLAWRRAFIGRQAARMAEISEKGAERHLKRQLDLQIEALRRRGIPEPVIQREISAAESAILAELCRITSGEADGGSGGAA